MAPQLPRSVFGIGRRLAAEYAGRKELERLRKASLPAGGPEQNPIGTTPTGELAYLDLDRWASAGAAGMNAAVVGAPGAGKSTALYRAMIECANQGATGVYVAMKGEAPSSMPKVRLSELISLPFLAALPEGYERLTEKVAKEFLADALDVRGLWPHGAVISAALRENISGRAPFERSVRGLLDSFHRMGREVDGAASHQQAARECRDRLGYLMELSETEQLFAEGYGDIYSDLLLNGLGDRVGAIEFDTLQYPVQALCEGGTGGFGLSDGERVSMAALPVLLAHCYSLTLRKRERYAPVTDDVGSNRHGGPEQPPPAILALDDADLLMKARRGSATAETILADSRDQGVSVWMSARQWDSLERLWKYLPTTLVGAPGEAQQMSYGEQSWALAVSGVRPLEPVLDKLSRLESGEFIYSSRGPGYGNERGIIRFFPAVESRPVAPDHGSSAEGSAIGASNEAQ